MNLQVELSTVCNWDCDYCPRPHLTREREFISSDTFTKALDTFIGDTTTLILSKDGEPLAHPNFVGLFKQATSRYVGNIDIYTNGVFLTDEVVDVLGAVQNSINLFITDHTTSRTGAQDSTKTLLNFTTAATKNYSNINFSLTRHSFNGEKEGDNDWLSTWDDYKDNNPNVISIHLNTDKNSWAGFIDTKLSDECAFMEYEFVGVGITGNVIMCCLDLNEELVVGNILTDNKKEIMLCRTNYKQLITAKDVTKINPCKRCIGAV